MASSPEIVPTKLVVDPIHGDIHLTNREWRILDTLAFQRLRNLKQLGMGHVTYPNATHTRFVHSLGTLAIMARILDMAKANQYRLEERQQENLRMAALLHDIGHYPYSHLMERVDSVVLTDDEVDGGTDTPTGQRPFDATQVGYPSHGRLGTEIVMHQTDLVKAIGGDARAKEVADLFTRAETADPQLSKLLHSSFDMDRVDYLQRDSHAAGVPYGNIDVNYLLNSLRISPTGMVGVVAKALPAAEQFLLARFFMHRAVYYHKTTYAMEEACRQLLRRIRDAGLFDIPAGEQGVLDIARSPALATFTDSYVDGLVHQASQGEDHVMKALARSIESRRPPKLLKEVFVFADAQTQHHAGSTFSLRAKTSLRALADRSGIALGQFLLCKTKPLTFEERGALLTTEQARDLAPEREDEMIKVFVGNDEEPTSLVEIPHSIIRICSGRFFQAFRLYVVYEGADKDQTIESLRDEVRDWDTAPS